MKKKIPVGATIAHAYRFAFGNFADVLKAIWLPLVLYLALCVPLLNRTALFLVAATAKDPAAGSLLGPLVLLYPVIIILFMMQVAAATEVALGLPITSRFYFPFGKKLWRLIGGYALAFAAIILLYIVYMIAIYAVGALAAAALKFQVGANAYRAIFLLTFVVSFLLGFGVMAFLGVRLLFLLSPASISERRLGVGRSWTLTRGNFWRAFLVTLAIFVPVMIVHYALQFSLAGFPPNPASPNPEVVKAARMAWNARMLGAMAANWFITLPVFFAVTLFYLGAGCAAQAFAWRKLTEDEGLAPIAGD